MARLLVVLFFAAVAPGCAAAPPPCGPENCTGCCEGRDRCVASQAVACGVNGAACVACSAAETCSAEGQCVATVRDAGLSSLRLRAVLRHGWSGDGGVSSALQAGATSAGLWSRGPMGLSFRPGLVSDDGVVVIGDVPPGPALVQLDETTFFETSERDVTFERFVGGRRDAVAADVSTPVSVQVDGLVSADAGHRVRVFFTQDAEALALESRAMPALSTGTTTFSAMLDWQTVSATGRARLPEAAAGDEGWFAQLLERSLDAGVSERQLVAATVFPPATFTRGRQASLRATAQAAPFDVVPLQVDVPAARRLLPSFGARPSPGNQFLFAVAVAPGPVGAAVTPLTTHVLRVPEASPVPASLSLGAPFPASWQTVVDARFQVTFARRASASAPVQNFAAGVRTVDTLAAFRTQRWVPPLGAPREVNASGRRLDFDVSQLGTSPVISWLPPAEGTPSAYRLTWYALEGARPPRVMWTTEPRIDVPPVVFTGSATWVLELAAVRTGDGRPGAALPLAEGLFVSGVLTP